jgi:hypothetical protein
MIYYEVVANNSEAKVTPFGRLRVTLKELNRLCAGVSAAPTRQISLKYFAKMCREDPNMLKIRQKYRTFYMKPYIRFIGAGDTNSPTQNSVLL